MSQATGNACAPRERAQIERMMDELAAAVGLLEDNVQRVENRISLVTRQAALAVAPSPQPTECLVELASMLQNRVVRLTALNTQLEDLLLRIEI